MRPVRLTLQGIHSYRDAVEIDFDELGRYGLFGIFGHIGSGKSTVLDGLTLALYGTVDRITGRSRRGLVNLASDRASVTLHFRVATPAGTAEYEVQRSYRAKDTGAERIASRLTQLGVPPVVLADKERDVNDTIVEIVGLSAEDFMRAVVLPQGKFQQLLHLKGSERRQMLQRIFRLHAYGEGLRAEVQRRQSDAKHELAQAQGELAGIGDATEAAIETATELAATARAQRQRAELAHETVASAHRDATQRQVAHRRLADARAELATHLDGRQAHEERQQRLDTAAEVAQILAPARQWQTAADHAAAAQEVLSRQSERLQAAREALDHARARHKAQQEALDTQRPVLEARHRQLQRTIEVVAQRAQATAALDAAVAEQQARVAERDTHEQTLTRAREARQAALDRRRTLRRKVRQLQVTGEERTRVRTATEAAQGLTRAQEGVKEARDQAEAAASEHDAAVAELRSAQTRAEQAAAQLPALREAHERASAHPELLDPAALTTAQHDLRQAEQHHVLRQARAQEVERATAHRERTDQAVQEARAALQRAEQEATSAQEVLRGAEAAMAAAVARWRDEQRKVLASELAQTLEPDTACPVCGSDHHPAPAAPTPAHQTPEAAAQAHQEGHRRATERQEAALTALGQAVAAHDAAQASQHQATEALAAAQQSLDALPTDDPAPIRQRLQAHDTAAAAAAQASQAYEAAKNLADRASQPVAVADAQVRQLRARLDRAEVIVASRNEAEGAAWATFNEERGELTLFDVSHAQSRLDKRDRQVDQLREELEAQEATLSEVDQTIASARDQLATAQTTSERAAASAEALRTSLEVLVPPLEVAAPEAALEETAESLKALQATVTQAHTTLETANEAHQVAARDHAAAEATHRTAQEARQVAERALQEIEAALPTPPPGDRAARVAHWSSLALTQEQRRVLIAEIDAWRERSTTLGARVATLEEAAGDAAPLSPEAFVALEHRLAEAASALETARQHSGAVEGRLADLRAKAPRHAELTTAVTETDAELGRLSVLSSVLRGDRFVEYVASDYLAELAERASQHLSVLTNGRYSLQIDQDVSFLVKDGHAGGSMRPVHTLSGGESFLTALSLALALSSQVQARSSRPLGFFFLDEGFGTLDPEALDRVMSAIEHLRSEERVIGLISHVPAVRERVPRYLWVERATPGGGTTADMRDN